MLLDRLAAALAHEAFRHAHEARQRRGVPESGAAITDGTGDARPSGRL
jgi:hypothetical protein